MRVPFRVVGVTARLSAAAIAGLVFASASAASGATPPAGVQAAVSVCPVVDAPAEGTIAGSLSEEDCTLDRLFGGDDTSHVDQYRVRVPNRGRLTVRMSAATLDPWLMLMAENARPVVTAGGGGTGSPALLEAVVPPGVYIVAANTADPQAAQRGDYTLALSLAAEPLPTECSVRTLAPDQTVAGTWIGADCRVLDRVPGEYGQGHAHAYSLTLAEAGAVTLDLTSGRGGIALTLYEADLEYLGGDWVDPDEQRPAAVERFLAAGSYVVLVAQVEAVEASYTLQSAFRPQPRRCTSTELAWGATRDGILSDDDCRASMLPGGRGQGPVDRFDVVVTQQGEVAISLESADFDAVLEVRDRQHGLVAESDDWEGSDARVSGPLGPGTYTIVARALGEEGRGAYRLRAQLAHGGGTGATCSVADLPLEEPVQGRLSDTDCTVEDFDGTLDPTYVDVHRLVLPAAGRLTLALTSDEFDPYLQFRGFAGRALAAGEGGSGSEAALDLVLPAGLYIVGANSYGPAVGSYELTASFQPLAGADCTPVELAPGARIAGTLSHRSCHSVLLEASPWLQTYVDRYRIRLPGRGALAATLSSTALGPHLMLFDGRGTRVLSESGATEATAAAMLPGGLYELWVAGAGPNETGAYDLVTTFSSRPAPACEPQDIGLPSRTPGTLTGSECALFDIVGHGADQTRMDAYRVSVPERGTLSLDVRSDDFDSMLWLFVPSLSWRDWDDDSGGEGNASLEVWLEPGTYAVGVLGFEADAVGGWVLDAAFVPDHQEPPGRRVSVYLPLALAVPAGR